MNPDDTLVRYSRLRLLPGTALRALLKAQELVALSLGLSFIEFLENRGRLGRDFVDARLDVIDAADAETTARLLRERLEKLPERRWPYYTPEARFAILELKQRNGWSAEDTARRFALSPNTIYNWLSRVSDETETVGSLVAPNPPVRRIADVVRELVRSLDRFGFGGSEKLAQVLARTGYRLSARSVGRIRKEDVSGPDAPTTIASPGRVLRAKFPNHIFMADVTEIPGRFRLFGLQLVVVLDVFSRMPLGWKIFYFKPTARQMARLFQSSVRRFGKPRYFVSDHGTEFTGKTFRRYLGAIGVKHRFGAVGRTGSITIIERFWRTLKDGLRARYSAPPLVLAQFDQRVRLELLYYDYFRPHQALGGATPAETYFGKKPRQLDATDPPRARAGRGPASLPVCFAFLDKERRFPILLRRAA